MFSNKDNKLVFHKLIEEIGGTFLNSTIRKYSGDYRSQHFDAKSHLNSMIYLNIKGCRSLRELEGEISSNKKLKSLINVVSGQVNDRKCIDGLFEDKDSIHVFDRGYYDYRWYDKLTEQGIRFVTRGIKNAIVMEDKMIDSNLVKDIYDTEIILGSTPGGNLTFKNYREIMTFDENGEVVTFITNIFDLATEDIIKIYKHRWKIEIFFKWIKQNLRIKKYIGYNENAIRIQIFSSLISYMLIYLSCKITIAKYAMLTLTRIVRSNLLESFDEYVIEYFRTS